MKDIISASEMDMTREGDGYGHLLDGIRKSFDDHVNGGDEPLFTTDAGDLYELFLSHLPAEARQHYNCNTCRHFVNRFGGLVKITDADQTKAVMWYNCPEFFREAVKAVCDKVQKSKITGVFITADKRLGIPKTGSWAHMAVDVPKKMLFTNRLYTPYQKAAEKVEEHRMLCRAVDKYSIDTVQTAVRLLRSDSLYRSEKVLGVAEWFMSVLDMAGKTKGKAKTNLLWKYAATAPVGFCHVSSSMIGTLLDDIEAGYNFDTVSRKFAEKMNPLQYQRPQAAPSAGNVAQAEKIVEKLGIEGSLRRRFARLDELQTVWTPRSAVKKPAAGGVFAGVTTKEKAARKPVNDVAAPATKITWEKFQRTVLPAAREIEYMVDYHRSSYSAIVTAADPLAPPIIKWDTEDERCPFNWYVYHNGSTPGEWNLRTGYCKVNAVVLQPNLWKPGYEHEGKSVFFILDGCKDRRYENSGIALFPETLKSELHEIRSTIEAFSRKGVLEGFEEASACGIRLQASSTWNHTFRVTDDLGTATYILDRWD